LLASTPNSPRWKPKNMKQYFTGDKASKTLHLIVLRVLWASRTTADDTVEQIVECLGLANELIMFVPEPTRETWCTENPIIVRKLQEKACQNNLDTRVQLPAFAFICSLCRSTNIPETMVDQLAALLSTATNLTSKLTIGSEPSVQWFAGVLNGVQLADIIISITSFAVEGSSADVVELADVMVSVVECLYKSSRTNESIIDGSLAALGSAAVAQDLTKLRQVFSNNSEGHAIKDGICASAVVAGRKAIGHAVCGLFLGAALTADHSQTDVATGMYPLLVETHTLSVRNSTICAHVTCLPRLQRQDQNGAANVAYPPGADWQRALGDHLQSKAQQDQSVLSAFFSSACADLERRCTQVEAPLREEQEKRKELQHQYDNLYRAYTGLEDNKSRVEMRADALETEKDEFAHDLEQTREENEGLLARVDELEANLRENQARAQEELERLKQDFANAELDHATASAQSEEHIEELEAKLSTFHTEQRDRDAADGQLRNELDGVRSSKDALEKEIHEWHTADEEHQRVIAAVEKSRNELEGKCAGLLAALEAVRQSMTSDQETHEAQMLRVEREAREEQVALRERHSKDINQINHQNREQLDDLSAKLASAQLESKQAQADLEARLDKREKKLADYHKKVSRIRRHLTNSQLTLAQIEHLKEVCTEKDDQIAEANAMRSNLMAAMGLGKMQGSQSAKRRSTRSAANHSELFDNTESSVPFIDILGAARASATQHNATQDSQIAPSPKRARSRKSVVSMAPPTQPRPSTAGRATRSSTQGRSATKRLPLLTISGNVSPSKSMNKTPGSSAMKAFDGAFDDTTFDGSEVFASTPGMVGRETEVLPDDDTEME
jgi:hypothetical protein